MNIKSLIEKNIYLYDAAAMMLKFGRNMVVSNLIDDVCKIDSIRNYDEFSYIIKKYKEIYGEQYLFMMTRYGKDSRLYGHLDTLYEYSKRNTETNYRAFSNVEHGTFLPTNGISPEWINFHGNTLLMGTYKSDLIHKINPLKPVFTVGPYIHYASPIYNTEELQGIKKKYGKTLLVFPSHSCEECGVSQDDIKFVDYVMSILAQDFDTVLVCVYWNDVNQHIFKMFQTAGAILVSNGFRGDINFIKRQKTLFMLSDEVCSNSFGTHIGYTIYEKKPFHYYDANTRLEAKTDTVKSELGQINELHSWTRECFEGNVKCELNESQNARYESMWGSREIKTPEELNDIISLGEMILNRSKGFISKFDGIVMDLLHDNSLTNGQLLELKKSLGSTIRIG